MQSTHEFQIGLVQMGNLYWVNHKNRELHVKDGCVVPKPYSPQASSCWAFMPYSAGLLQAHTEKHSLNPGRYHFLKPIYKRVSVSEAVYHLKEADVVGFSAYVWNIQRSLRIARVLKVRKPTLLVIFGGPQVPDVPDRFLIENTFIDVVCHGEGEEVFRELLDHAVDRRWESVPSISYLKDGRVVTHSRTPRIRDLSVIPSPYLSGAFDKMIQDEPSMRWIALWETNRGCPFSCTFCDWGSAVARKVYRFDMDRLKSEMEWFAEHRISNIAICDANFGILPRDTEIAAMMVSTYKKRKIGCAVSFQGAKNSTERSYEIQRLFAQAGLATLGVTIALQSVNEQVLKAIKRDNISLDSYEELQRRHTESGLDTYTDLILGLPGETYDSFADGVAQVIAGGQHNRLVIYNCSILPNAEMGNDEYQKRYGLRCVPIRMIQEFAPVTGTDSDEIPEFLNTVVATQTMPKEDWVRARSFGWMVLLLHCNRLLQLPFIVLAENCDASYRELVESLLDADRRRFPVCAEIADLFRMQASAMQSGDPECIPSLEWLGVWWRPDMYAIVKLVVEHKLDAFYLESHSLLEELLSRKHVSFDSNLLRDTVNLNHALLRVPAQWTDIDVTVSHNILEFCNGVRRRSPVPLTRKGVTYSVNRTSTVWLSWQAWCEEFLMRVHKRDRLLYDVKVKQTR